MTLLASVPPMEPKGKLTSKVLSPKGGEHSMSYGFRVRFQLPNDRRLGISENSLILTPLNALNRVELQGPKPLPTKKTFLGRLLAWPSQRAAILPAIEDSTALAIRGYGYDTAERARDEGEKYRDALTLALLEVRVGADFGDRSLGRSRLTGIGAKGLARMFGVQRVIADNPGLQVFEEEPSPVLLQMNTDAIVTTSVPDLSERVQRALESGVRFTPVHRTAFDLYSASHFLRLDARFMMLMMSLETMLKLNARSELAQKHVDELIRYTEASRLDDRDKKSMVGTLQWLKKESIRQAGLRMAQALGGRQYLGMGSGDFFNYCYKLRGSLVHGEVPRRSATEVNAALPELDRFVSDLILARATEGQVNTVADCM